MEQDCKIEGIKTEGVEDNYKSKRSGPSESVSVSTEDRLGRLGTIDFSNSQDENQHQNRFKIKDSIEILKNLKKNSKYKK